MPKILINTGEEQIDLLGEVFPKGEWRHLPDDFGITRDENGEILTDALADYPQLKTPVQVLEERTRQVLLDSGLVAFAQGVKTANEANDQPSLSLKEIPATSSKATTSHRPTSPTRRLPML